MSRCEPAPAVRAARRRLDGIALALTLPLAVGTGALAGRLAGANAALVAGAAVLATGLAWRWRAGRALAPAAVVRRLDARPDLEDSADLLLRDAATLGPLQRLQRARVLDRLAAAPADLRLRWPRAWLAGAWLVGIAALSLAIAWPRPPAPTIPPPPAAGADAETPAGVRLVETRVHVAPPAYTGLAPTTSDALSLRAPQDARLRWSLRFMPDPEAVAVVFQDGTRLPLSPRGGAWEAEHVLAASRLYRLEITHPLPPAGDPLHRLEAVADHAPVVRTRLPDRNLSLRAEDQRDWPLRFEASDDHALGAARLVVTMAKGSGEQVEVTESTLPMRGEGEAREKTYAHRLDLAALGLAEGDDLIVRFEVADTRAPRPQWSRSASFILRWPPPAGAESTGMEGLVKRAMPAYFRSQRQIILDIEALVPQRPRRPAGDFVARSDAIGVDQRILRLRYGQFLGEEDAPGPQAPPTGDHDDGHAAGDGHGHEGEPPAPLGGAIAVLEDYGHTHDDAEAATLLDPETRALLKQALDAMWSSEGELRQGQPERALPHAYRALDYIKRAQQATRIYLARVGLELPPIDPARRMTGKREGIADRRDGLVPAAPPDSPVPALWQALAPDAVAPPDLQPFADWLAGPGAAREDALDLAEALDAVRRDPACGDCRARLRARLWPLLPPVPAQAPARPAPDAAGEAYLRALGAEAPP